METERVETENRPITFGQITKYLPLFLIIFAWFSWYFDLKNQISLIDNKQQIQEEKITKLDPLIETVARIDEKTKSIAEQVSEIKGLLKERGN